jgi:hypothetical protein
MATKKQLMKMPEWDELEPNLNLPAPATSKLAVLALDAAKSTGWCVATVEQEPLLFYGQCPINELADWVTPVTDNYHCLVMVERGYISGQSGHLSRAQREHLGQLISSQAQRLGASPQGAEDLVDAVLRSLPDMRQQEARKKRNERALMQMFERFGRVLDFVRGHVNVVGPVWRPTANQWRKLHKNWPVRMRREDQKLMAVEVAETLTGASFRTQPHWYKNGRRVGGNSGALLDDAADAVCQAMAGMELAARGGWPTWEELDT